MVVVRYWRHWFGWFWPWACFDRYFPSISAQKITCFCVQNVLIRCCERRRSWRPQRGERASATGLNMSPNMFAVDVAPWFGSFWSWGAYLPTFAKSGRRRENTVLLRVEASKKIANHQNEKTRNVKSLAVAKRGSTKACETTRYQPVPEQR